MTSATTPHQITGPQTYAIGSPIGPTSVAESEGIGFGDIMRILKQRKLTVVVAAAVIYTLVVTATVLIAMFAPAYTSEAIFELEPPKFGEFIAHERDLNTKYMEQLLQTEARNLKNLDLLLKVVEQPEVKNTAYYRWYNSDAMESAVGLRDDLVAGPIPNTRLIRVALSCRDRDEARTIVQAVVARYQKLFTEHEEDEMLDQRKALEDTLAAKRNELERIRSELKEFRERTNIPAMELHRLEAREHVVQLRAEAAKWDAEVALMDGQLKSLEGIDPSRLPLTAEQQLIIEADPILRYWRSQVESLDVEIASRAQHVGPNHRDIVQLEKRRVEFYEKERAKREELMAQVRARQIETIRQQMAQGQTMLGRVKEQLASVEAEESDLDRNLQAYMQLEEDARRLSEQIGMIELKLAEAEHAARDKSRTRLWLRQAPQVAIEPSRPRLIPYLSGGFILALAGGIGFAFLRELTDQAVRTPVDVARFCRLSVLGCIPQLDDEQAEQVEEIEEAVRKAPYSLVAEAFRRTRTNLQFSGPVDSQRALLITSPSPSDGKTAVAINLATTLANGGLRVLLVDCNFRRPAIREAYANTRPEGLSNILIGQGRLADFATNTDLSTLDVLSSGPMPPTPAELLGSTGMRELIKEAIEQYDRVILDGPPTLLISDASVLAMEVDGVILVTRAEENSRGVVRRAREQLEGLNARIVGAILNGVKTRPGGYFKQQYRDFYDYTSDETIPAELPGPPPDTEAASQD